MKIIQAQEKYLSFNGDTEYALRFVESIRNAFDESGNEMPKMLNDFVFNIEVALQNENILDENFNKRI
jgi:predicted lipid carrier protein YhbT